MRLLSEFSILLQHLKTYFYFTLRSCFISYLVWDMELLHQVALQKHPYRRLTSVIVRQIKVYKRKTVQIIAIGRWYVRLNEPFRRLVARGRVVGQALERHLLFRHQLARVLVHLRVVYPESAENREGLEKGHVAVREGRPVGLVDQLRDADHRLLPVQDRHAEDRPRRFRVTFAVLLLQPGPHVADVQDLAGCGRVPRKLGRD